MLRRDTQCVESVLPVRQPSLNPTSYLCTLTAIIWWAVLVGCFNLPTFLLFPPSNGYTDYSHLKPTWPHTRKSLLINTHTHTRAVTDWWCDSHDSVEIVVDSYLSTTFTGEPKTEAVAGVEEMFWMVPVIHCQLLPGNSQTKNYYTP